jgi:hypothetical protein
MRTATSSSGRPNHRRADRLFRDVDKKWRIYARKEGAVSPTRLPLARQRPVMDQPPRTFQPRKPGARAAAVVESALAARYGKPCVLLDAELNASTSTATFTATCSFPQASRPRHLQLMRPNLRLHLRSALQKAGRSEERPRSATSG